MRFCILCPEFLRAPSPEVLVRRMNKTKGRERKKDTHAYILLKWYALQSLNGQRVLVVLMSQLLPDNLTRVSNRIYLPLTDIIEYDRGGHVRYICHVSIQDKSVLLVSSLFPLPVPTSHPTFTCYPGLETRSRFSGWLGSSEPSPCETR